MSDTKQKKKEDDSVVYITVIGDQGVGKTSLIAAAATETFPDNPPPVLPPAKLPADTTPEGVPVVITDTSTRSEDKEALEAACRQASVIVLCFRMEKLESLRRISSYWMPELKRLNVQVPVLLVGCKSDIRPADQSLHKAVLPIVKSYPQIETCMECSSKKLQFVGEVFYYALKAVVYPMTPLYDPESQLLQPLCVRALKRIFSLCDQDEDGVLNDNELNEFQMRCFNAPLQPEELAGVKEVVKSRMESGLSPKGFLTFQGFLFLHALFIERGRLETTWAVLSKFGYGKDLKLRDDLLMLKNGQDTPMQLTEFGEAYFSDIFNKFDVDNDAALSAREQEELFSSFPEAPSLLQKTTSSGIVFERTKKGLLTRGGYMAMWNYLATKSPKELAASAIYLGLDCEKDGAILARLLEPKRMQEPKVVQCNVFSPDEMDISEAITGLLQPNNQASSGVVMGSAGLVENDNHKSTTLVLRSVPLSLAPTIIEASDRSFRFSTLDAAAFAFDWSKPKQISTLVEGMLSIASAAGDNLPCVLIGFNRDQASESFVAEVQMICDTLGISEPLNFDPRESAHVYRSLVHAASIPEGHIPETPSLVATKRHRRLVARITMYAGIGTMVGIAGYLSYRAYRDYRSSYEQAAAAKR